jgi:hypothetical protein
VVEDFLSVDCMPWDRAVIVHADLLTVADVLFPGQTLP